MLLSNLYANATLQRRVFTIRYNTFLEASASLPIIVNS